MSAQRSENAASRVSRPVGQLAAIECDAWRYLFPLGHWSPGSEHQLRLSSVAPCLIQKCRPPCSGWPRGAHCWRLRQRRGRSPGIARASYVCCADIRHDNGGTSGASRRSSTQPPSVNCLMRASSFLGYSALAPVVKQLALQQRAIDETMYSMARNVVIVRSRISAQ